MDFLFLFFIFCHRNQLISNIFNMFECMATISILSPAKRFCEETNSLHNHYNKMRLLAAVAINLL